MQHSLGEFKTIYSIIKEKLDYLFSGKSLVTSSAGGDNSVIYQSVYAGKDRPVSRCIGEMRNEVHSPCA